jgi:very-short-patch-repair endonuclease
VMRPYLRVLKENSRSLRCNMTEAEVCLWARLRRKQVGGVQFYRQKPLLCFIVDFYCPAAGLVIELDGSQHYEPEHRAKDEAKDEALGELGLRVLRFPNGRVLRDIDGVVAQIRREIPLGPPLRKGEAGEEGRGGREDSCPPL